MNWVFCRRILVTTWMVLFVYANWLLLAQTQTRPAPKSIDIKTYETAKSIDIKTYETAKSIDIKAYQTPNSSHPKTKKKTSPMPNCMDDPAVQTFTNLSLRTLASGNGRFSRLGDDLIVFAAYRDKRTTDLRNSLTKTADAPVVVRIMAIVKTRGTVIEATNSRFARRIWCIERNLKRFVPAQFYEMCENHAATYGGYIVTCKWGGNDTQTVPDSVANRLNRGNATTGNSIMLWDNESHKQLSVAVVEPVKQKTTNHEISKLCGNAGLRYVICVHTPLHGMRYNARYVAEFIELQLALGVDHLMFYMLKNGRKAENEPLRRILRWYSSRGVVTLIEWPIGSVLPQQQIWYMGQLVVVQDCLYRAMAAGVQHLAVHDLDEIIVPQHSDINSLPKLVEYLWKRYPSAAGFRIAPQLHHSPPEKATSIFKASAAIAYHLEEGSFQRQLTKPLVRPERIFELGIHHISKQFHEEQHNLLVNETDAVMHHYSSRFNPKLMEAQRDLTSTRQWGAKLIQQLRNKVQKRALQVLLHQIPSI